MVDKVEGVKRGNENEQSASKTDTGQRHEPIGGRQLLLTVVCRVCALGGSVATALSGSVGWVLAGGNDSGRWGGSAVTRAEASK